MKKAVKRETKKKPVKPKQTIVAEKEKGDDVKGTKDAASAKTNDAESVVSDDSNAIKTDILSLAERLAQKKSKSNLAIRFKITKA